MSIAIDVRSPLSPPLAFCLPFLSFSKVSASNSGTFSYRSLEVYLVSATAGKNITISNSTQLLTQEPASTVKHINWPVATCLQTGEYNVCNNALRVDWRPLTAITAHCLRGIDPH